MKKLVLFAVIALLVSSCSKPSFTIQGHIKDAVGDTLYFTHTATGTLSTLDSLIIKEDGSFVFSAPAPKYPDFYRITMHDQSIVVAVDSTENITIEGQAKDFAVKFEVENSPATDKIRQLRASVSQTNLLLSVIMVPEEIRPAIEKHKDLAKKIILEDPKSLAAYYAINQNFKGYYYLIPDNKDDLIYWSAVATAFEAYRPNDPRTPVLKKLALEGIKTVKLKEENPNGVLLKAKEIGFIDITLPDTGNRMVSLSDYTGQFVLIDFCLLGAENAPAHNLLLRDVYNKYHKAGLEIFQVDFDANKLLWLERAKNLPWICVRDEKATDSQYMKLYNVQNLPTIFLMNKNGDIISRPSGLEELESVLKENLDPKTD